MESNFAVNPDITPPLLADYPSSSGSNIGSVETKVQLSRKKKVLFALIVGTILFILAVVVAEIALRVKGHQPWGIKKIFWVVEPGNKFWQKHPVLGYTLYPGRFKITWHEDFSFTATHWDPSITRLDYPLRATHSLETYDPQSSKEEIWIFGGSWTYGSRINDEETYPWLLQERFAEYEVLNFGVSGYGTLHSLIQLRRAIEQRCKPGVAIFAYASFHDSRNTFLRNRRKVIAPYCKLGPLVQPYARLDENGKLTCFMAETEYREIPLMRRSALVHYLERKYNDIEDGFYHSHEVSKAIIKEANDICNRNGATFILAGIDFDADTLEVLEFCKKENILATDISVDRNIAANTLSPYDAHPSALANKQYAQKLGDFLQDHVLKSEGRGEKLEAKIEN